MMHALRSAKEIGYTGQVSRAGVHLGGDRNQGSCLISLKSFVFCFSYTAICGNSTIGSNLLQSQVTLVNIGLKPGAFCSALNVSNTLNWFVSPQILNSPATIVINDVNLPLLYFSSQNGEILVVQLDEKCGYPVPSTTTPSQNLNITQANTTTNTTSFPQNTTVEPQNSTFSTNANAANSTSTTTNTMETTTESG